MSEKNPIKVGIWGLGRAGYSMHCKELDAYPEEFKVVAGCDLEQERLDRLTQRYPECHVYLDGNAFLADPEVELVAVAVRSPQHVDYALRALEAGKIVFLEKPIALCMEGLAKLEAAVKKYPGKLYFRHNRRFEIVFNRLLEFIHGGKLGRVYEIKLRRNFYQFREDWQAIRNCGGGQLTNWGPHLIDQSLQLLESPVKDLWSNLQLVTARGDAEDHLKIVFKGENGRVVDMEISGGVAITPPIATLYGTRGTAECTDKVMKLKYLKPDMEMPTYAAHPETPSLKAPFSGLVKPEFVEEELPVTSNDEEGIDETGIYHKLYATIRDGKPFRIKPEEAFAVVEIMDRVRRQNPDFPGWHDEYGK